MPKRTIHAHTALRGIASVMVMLYHYRLAWPHGSWLDGQTAFLISAEYMVDFFFMLSGFVIALVYLPQAGGSWRIWRDYMQSRLARVYPLHLATLLWMMALVAASGTFPADLRMETLRNLLLVQAWGFQDQFALNYPSWSVSGEVAAYLLFPALAFGYLRFGKGFVLAAAALAVTGLIAHDMLTGAGVRWERLALLRALPGFAIGVALHVCEGPGIV